MQITMSASGTRQQIAASIDNQSRQIGKQAKEVWPVVSNLRDAIAADLAGRPGEGPFTVSVSVSVAIIAAPAQPQNIPLPKPAESKTVTEPKES
jgi:hypothetical protein